MTHPAVVDWKYLASGKQDWGLSKGEIVHTHGVFSISMLDVIEIIARSILAFWAFCAGTNG